MTIFATVYPGGIPTFVLVLVGLVTACLALLFAVAGLLSYLSRQKGASRCMMFRQAARFSFMASVLLAASMLWIAIDEARSGVLPSLVLERSTADWPILAAVVGICISTAAVARYSAGSEIK